MDCKYFRDLLSAYIDGYINEKERKEIEEHLSQCEGCKNYFMDLKNAVNIIKDVEKIEAPIGFEKEVIEKIKEKEKEFGWFFNKKLIIEFSIATFLFASIFLIYLNLIKSKEIKAPQIIKEEKVVITEKEIKKTAQKEKLKEIQEKPKPIKEKKETPSRLEGKKEKEKLENLKSMEVVKKEPFKEELKKDKALEPQAKKIEEVFVVREAPLIDVAPKKTDKKFEENVFFKKIDIKVYGDLSNTINEIEEILKKENIKYLIKKEEKFAQIMVSFKDFKFLIEKIKSYEGLKIEEYDEEIKEDETIEIRVLPEIK